MTQGRRPRTCAPPAGSPAAALPFAPGSSLLEGEDGGSADPGLGTIVPATPGPTGMGRGAAPRRRLPQDHSRGPGTSEPGHGPRPADPVRVPLQGPEAVQSNLRRRGRSHRRRGQRQSLARPGLVHAGRASRAAPLGIRCRRSSVRGVPCPELEWPRLSEGALFTIRAEEGPDLSHARPRPDLSRFRRPPDRLARLDARGACASRSSMLPGEFQTRARGRNAGPISRPRASSSFHS